MDIGRNTAWGCPQGRACGCQNLIIGKAHVTEEKKKTVNWATCQNHHTISGALENAKGKPDLLPLRLIVCLNYCLTSFKSLLGGIFFSFFLSEENSREMAEHWREVRVFLLRLWLIDKRGNETSVIHAAFSPGTRVTRTEAAFVRISEGPVFYPSCLPCLLVKEGGKSATAWRSVAPALHFHRRLLSAPRLKKVRWLIYTLSHMRPSKISKRGHLSLDW